MFGSSEGADGSQVRAQVGAAAGRGQGFSQGFLLLLSLPHIQAMDETLLGQQERQRRKQEHGANREREAHGRRHTGTKSLCNTLEEGDEEELKARAQGPT